MDIVTQKQEHRLAALQRVVTATAVNGTSLRRELTVTAVVLLGVLASVGLLFMAVLGALWLFT